MAWDFDATLATDKDRVRLKIGDINSADELLQNETIQAILDQGKSVVGTSIECINAIIALLSRDTDRSNVGMSTTRSQKIAHYEILLKNLKAENALGAAPKFGGTSDSEKDTLEDDADFRSSPFSRDRNDNRRV